MPVRKVGGWAAAGRRPDSAAGGGFGCAGGACGWAVCRSESSVTARRDGETARRAQPVVSAILPRCKPTSVDDNIWLYIQERRLCPTKRPRACRAADRAGRRRAALPRQRARVRRPARSGRSSARWTSTRRSRATLLDDLFDLGVMGIEIPEAFGGAGAQLLPRGARRRGAVAGRSVDRRPRRRPEHARHQRPAPLGQRRDQAPLPARAREPHGRRLRAVGGRLGQRRLRPGHAGHAERATASSLTGRKLWITNGNEADLFIVFANVNPDAGYRGITAFLVERGLPGLHGRQEGRQARHPREQHLRAAPRGLRRAARRTSSARSARATRSRSRRSTRGGSASARR